jgi:hypothetical protein
MKMPDRDFGKTLESNDTQACRVQLRKTCRAMGAVAAFAIAGCIYWGMASADAQDLAGEKAVDLKVDEQTADRLSVSVTPRTS